MKYRVRKFTAYHIFWIIFLIGFCISLGVYYFNPVTGMLFVLAGLLYAWYLFVWKLEFDTNTGDFECRTLFYRQRFHASDIKSYGTMPVFHANTNRQFWLTVSKDGIEQDVYMPDANTKELKQYLERRKSRL